MTQHPDSATASPRYRILVLIGWRILWQAVGSFLLLMFLVNLALLSWLPELTRSGPSFWALLFPLIVVTVMVAFMVMPAVVRGLLNASFGGLRLRLVSEQDASNGHRATHVPTEGGRVMKRIMGIVTLALMLGLSPPAMNFAQAQDPEPDVVSGTLVTLDLENLKGLLTTDLGKPVFFEVPKAYLFENVTVGARITIQLDDQGRAVKVMDTALPDLVPDVMPTSHAGSPPQALGMVHGLSSSAEEVSR